MPTRSKDRFLVFGAPDIGTAEIEEVVDSIQRGWLGTGPKVAAFEEAFRQYKEAGHAVAVNSCTAALHLSMIAAGIAPGDEIIVPAMTFCSTVNAIIHANAVPVLVDVDPTTMNIDPNQVAAKITSKTKGIICVHFAGRACDMDAICKICNRYDLKLIEDCAHAIETEYKGRKTGTFGDFGCFSFYVTKNVITGEGGMVVAAKESDAARIKTLALHGMSKDAWKRFADEGYKHYQVVECGFKYNMMDIQAAIGIHQLKRVEKNWIARKKIWNRYNEAFKHLPCILPSDPASDTRHGYHLYTPLIDIDKTGRSRDWVLDAMTHENIGVGVHYIPVHLHPFYQKEYGWEKGDFPHAEWIGDRTVSLPLSPALTEQDVNDVIAAFTKVLT